MMGLAIIGVPLNLFGNHDFECHNPRSSKYESEVSEEEVCDCYEAE
jgi:hypothetical protein